MLLHQVCDQGFQIDRQRNTVRTLVACNVTKNLVSELWRDTLDIGIQFELNEPGKADAATIDLNRLEQILQHSAARNMRFDGREFHVLAEFVKQDQQSSKRLILSAVFPNRCLDDISYRFATQRSDGHSVCRKHFMHRLVDGLVLFL